MGSPVSGRHTNRSSAWRFGPSWDWRGILLPVLIVVGVLAAVTITNWNFFNHPAPAHSSKNGPGSSAASGPNGNASSQPNALAGCVRLFTHQSAATQAANSSLDQWKLHIQAMNQLVAGQITLKQAQKYWAQTRAGAIHKVLAFQRLRQRLDGLQCPGVASSGSQLTACQRATAAYAGVVKAAGVTVSTWNMHIQEMEDLVAGRITPTQALHMWTRMWHLGQRQLQSYNQALGRAQQESCVG